MYVQRTPNVRSPASRGIVIITADRRHSGLSREFPRLLFATYLASNNDLMRSRLSGVRIGIKGLGRAPGFHVRGFCGNNVQFTVLWSATFCLTPELSVI